MSIIKENELNDRQKAFCYEYIANNFNGTRAARAAGYEGNDNTLGVTAHNLLRNSKITSLVAKLKKEYFDDKERIGRDVIAELYNLGMRRISDIVRKKESGDVEIKDFVEMGGSEAAINKLEVKQTELTNEDGEKIGITTETKVWLENKTKPLELLAKYAGVIVDKQEIDHNIKSVDEVKITVVDPKKLKEEG